MSLQWQSLFTVYLGLALRYTTILRLRIIINIQPVAPTGILQTELMESRDMFTKALVPLDGTEISEGIIPFITQLARGLEMGVVLATAVQLDARLITYLDRMADNLAEPVTGRDPGDRPAASDQLKESLAREIKGRLDELADRMSLEGIPTETTVEFGKVSDTVIRMAQNSECDLIAMSTRGRSALASGLLGSVAYNVIHESPIPILVITPERAKLHWDADYSISRVIVPLDGSEFAETALPYAASLSRKMDMGVTLIQVLPQDEFIYGGGYHISEYLPRIREELQTEARRYLAGVAWPLRQEGLEVSAETVHGSPSSRIVQIARAADHDMIALTTHGRSGISRLLLGSVAEAIVRESGDPVLIVPPATS